MYIKSLFLHFDLGYSYYSNAPVKELIFNRLPATLSLALGGAVVWLVAGLGVGIVSARRAGSRLDRLSMGTALVLVSAPEYWLGPDQPVPVRVGHRAGSRSFRAPAAMSG